MTLAICIKCGDKKLGALTPCSACKFEPQEAADQAKSLMLSDHNMSEPDLASASEKLKRGEAVAFDDASLRELAEAMDIIKPTYFFGVRKTSWVMLGIAIAIGVCFGGCAVTMIQLLGL